MEFAAEERAHRAEPLPVLLQREAVGQERHVEQPGQNGRKVQAEVRVRDERGARCEALDQRRERARLEVAVRLGESRVVELVNSVEERRRFAGSGHQRDHLVVRLQCTSGSGQLGGGVIGAALEDHEDHDNPPSL